MTREQITRIAREAGFVGMDGDHGALRRFAALVAKHTLANIDPSSLMSWQEGYAAGAAAEREACAKVCEDKAAEWRKRSVPLLGYSGELEDCAAAIRARNNI